MNQTLIIPVDNLKFKRSFNSYVLGGIIKLPAASCHDKHKCSVYILFSIHKHTAFEFLI